MEINLIYLKINREEHLRKVKKILQTPNKGGTILVHGPENHGQNCFALLLNKEFRNANIEILATIDYGTEDREKNVELCLDDLEGILGLSDEKAEINALRDLKAKRDIHIEDVKIYSLNLEKRNRYKRIEKITLALQEKLTKPNSRCAIFFQGLHEARHEIKRSLWNIWCRNWQHLTEMGLIGIWILNRDLKEEIGEPIDIPCDLIEMTPFTKED